MVVFCGNVGVWVVWCVLQSVRECASVMEYGGVYSYSGNVGVVGV
jgi:hypothetical protein